MPAASRPGTSTKPSNGPPNPDASMRRKAPAIGEPSRVLTAAKAAGRGHHGDRLLRGIRFGPTYDQGGQPSADGDQGRFRPEYGTERQGGQGGQYDAG